MTLTCPFGSFCWSSSIVNSVLTQSTVHRRVSLVVHGAVPLLSLTLSDSPLSPLLRPVPSPSVVPTHDIRQRCQNWTCVPPHLPWPVRLVSLGTKYKIVLARLTSQLSGDSICSPTTSLVHSEWSPDFVHRHSSSPLWDFYTCPEGLPTPYPVLFVSWIPTEPEVI